MRSWARVRSTPTGRAPRLANQADRYAVPHPNSITSSPRTSPRTRTSRSGTWNKPHVTSPAAHARKASSSANAEFTNVHNVRFATRSVPVSATNGHPLTHLQERVPPAGSPLRRATVKYHRGRRPERGPRQRRRDAANWQQSAACSAKHWIRFQRLLQMTERGMPEEGQLAAGSAPTSEPLLDRVVTRSSSGHCCHEGARPPHLRRASGSGRSPTSSRSRADTSQIGRPDDRSHRTR